MTFSSADSLGSLPIEQIADYLENIGDSGRARALVEAAVQGQSLWRPNAPFYATGAQIGFISPGEQHSRVPIVSATQMTADPDLVGTQVKISFDRAFIREYPGTGVHSILCEFVGRNQVKGDTEALRMALRFKSVDNAGVSTLGIPIFLGLTVSPNGIAFEGSAINVSSSADEFLLEALDSEAFKGGLSLINSVQPGLRPFVALMQSAVKNVAKRSKNKQVHNFNLGLDFSNTSTSARLRLGSYVIVQSNKMDWDWSDFYWDGGSNSVRRKSGHSEDPIDFNYMIIGVAPYTSTPESPSTRSAKQISATPK